MSAQERFHGKAAVRELFQGEILEARERQKAKMSGFNGLFALVFGMMLHQGRKRLGGRFFQSEAGTVGAVAPQCAKAADAEQDPAKLIASGDRIMPCRQRCHIDPAICQLCGFGAMKTKIVIVGWTKDALAKRKRVGDLLIGIVNLTAVARVLNDRGR